MVTPANDDSTATGQRDTVKHGRLLDEAQSAEDRSFTRGAPVEARRREERLKEVVDEDMPGAGTRPEGTSTAGLDEEEAALRAELVDGLASAPFPCDAAALMRHLGVADRRGDAAARLRMLPGDHRFENVTEVLHALSGTSLSERGPGPT
jgi:hypothetical protein